MSEMKHVQNSFISRPVSFISTELQERLLRAKGR